MTGRHREWLKSIACAALVLAYFLWAAGWVFTLAFVVLCVVAWWLGYQRPLARMARQAKRKG